MELKSLVSHPNARALQLATSRTVNADTRVSAVSKFEDVVWDMRSKMMLPGAKQTSWDFSTVAAFPEGFALGLAEYAFHRLYKPVASHARAGDWLTVFNELVALRMFAAFCAGQGLRSFSDVDTEICYLFLGEIRGDGNELGKSEERIRVILRTIYRLWEYRDVLSEPLICIPFGSAQENLLKKASRRSEGTTENRTPVIPESVYGPLMAAALDYVLHHSTLILAARNKLRNSWDEVSRNANFASASLTTRNRVVATLAERVTNDFDSPWLSSRWRGQRDLFNEMQQLRRACIIVILAYSGIRSSELLSLEANSCVEEDAGDGRTRYYIRTVLHKNRGIGSRESWVVIEEVARAIRLLEDLTKEVRDASRSNKLFLTLSGRFTVVGVSRQKSRNGVMTNEAVLYQIRAFVKSCNTSLIRTPIPDWQDEAGVVGHWRLNMRQFRRTLARFIARQPFGIIAGMLQYKHVETACFEGYAGSEPSWNKMLAEEKVLASVNILDEIAIDLSHNSVAGKLGESLQRDFHVEFRGRAEDYPPSQIARWLASKKSNLFVGKFNFCFFNEEKAVCTMNSARKDAPILNSCDPTRCSNACIGERHAPLWQAQLDQAIDVMKHPKVSELQRATLKSEVNYLTSVVKIIGREHVHGQKAVPSDC